MWCEHEEVNEGEEILRMGWEYSEENGRVKMMIMMMTTTIIHVLDDH